jgi:solute carrier family 25 citrate transporter 1
MDYQPVYAEKGDLPSWQTMIMGLVSGAMGPFSNAPIDTIKTYVRVSGTIGPYSRYRHKRQFLTR